MHDEDSTAVLHEYGLKIGMPFALSKLHTAASAVKSFLHKENAVNEANKVKTGMGVFCSCGKRLGTVNELTGEMIKLNSSDSAIADFRFVPVEWVERVDRSVYLNKNSEEVLSEWTEKALAL